MRLIDADALIEFCAERWIPLNIDAVNMQPTAQPTLCGYNIEHLILIANVLRKENLPPERVVEALTDIGRIVSIVKDEFENRYERRSMRHADRLLIGKDGILNE